MRNLGNEQILEAPLPNRRSGKLPDREPVEDRFVDRA
jgi:hypothetical protein